MYALVGALPLIAAATGRFAGAFPFANDAASRKKHTYTHKYTNTATSKCVSFREDYIDQGGHLRFGTDLSFI